MQDTLTPMPLPRSAGQPWATGHDVAADRSNGWVVIPAWGRDGWDLGSWPLVVIMHRKPQPGENRAEPWGLLEYVEGDVDVSTFATYDELVAATDKLAEFHWRHGQPDVDGIGEFREGQLPARMKGPFSWERLERGEDE